MAISDRLLGKKNINGKPHIETVQPGAALPGGEVRILGKGLRPPELRRPRVQFGDVEGAVLISSDDFLVARVPEGATSGPVVVATNGHVSNPHQVKVAIPIAENLHPACGRQQKAEQDREGRRLAGTIAAEQCRGDTTPDGKADAVYRDGARIVLDEIFDFDRKFDHRPNMVHDRSSSHHEAGAAGSNRLGRESRCQKNWQRSTSMPASA